jgi:hypothetical protein
MITGVLGGHGGVVVCLDMPSCFSLFLFYPARLAGRSRPIQGTFFSRQMDALYCEIR